MYEGKPIPLDVLLGDVESQSEKQRAARQVYIKEGFHLTDDWLIYSDPVNQLATTIYNVIVESGPGDPRFAQFEDDDLTGTWIQAGCFAEILEEGGDAFLWTLIRIGLDEAENGDVVGLANRRGYVVRETPRVAEWLKWAKGRFDDIRPSLRVITGTKGHI
jgi:hypothetical protein